MAREGCEQALREEDEQRREKHEQKGGKRVVIANYVAKRVEHEKGEKGRGEEELQPTHIVQKVIIDFSTCFVKLVDASKRVLPLASPFKLGLFVHEASNDQRGVNRVRDHGRDNDERKQRRSGTKGEEQKQIGVLVDEQELRLKQLKRLVAVLGGEGKGRISGRGRGTRSSYSL